ncbi:chlorophyll synthase, chloroplastic-like [Arachis duranensis]|uniref:Chlorophyll synthase, chloroplastic-like n=1 Tax=Arachis duranensis TaxID=130453 RepID=A0A9C6TS80_ARADU|nr:chlorophyll synthase, chloroplastic-like [Arachis duranensis]
MASLSLNMVSVPPRTTTISCTRTRVPSLPFSFTRRRLTIRATETDTNNVKSQAPDKAPSKDGSSMNQLLGIKGAAQESLSGLVRLCLGHSHPTLLS